MLSKMSLEAFLVHADAYAQGCNISTKSVSVVDRACTIGGPSIKDIADLNASVDESVLINTINNFLYQNVYRQYIFCNLVDNHIDPSAQTIDRYILPLFIDHFKGDINKFAVKKPFNIPNPDPSCAISIEVQDIIDYYQDDFNIEFFESLLQISLPSNPVMGKSELFLALMTNFTNSTSHGDLMLGDSIVEVKGVRGRAGGVSKSDDDNKRGRGITATKHIKEILTRLNLECYNDELEFGLSTYYGRMGKKVFNAIDLLGTVGKLDGNATELQTALEQGLKAVYVELQNYIIYDDFSVPNDHLSLLKQAIMEKRTDAFAGALHLYNYKLADGFDRLLLLNGYYTGSKVLVINTEDICLLDLYNIIKTENIKIEGGWGDSPMEFSGHAISYRG